MGDAGVVDVSLVLDAETLAVEREVDAVVVDALGLELANFEGAFADRVGPNGDELSGFVQGSEATADKPGA